MEDAIKLFRTQLFDAFRDWIETNKEAIGEKWYKTLQKEGKNAENLNTAGGIMAASMWMLWREQKIPSFTSNRFSH